MNTVDYDVIVVGGGMAGLTSAAYVSKAGKKVLLCEKEKKLGGLVNSFDFNGFKFDGGVRAFADSGIITPMTEQLGLGVEFLPNNISIGFEKEVIKIASKESLEAYKALLCSKFNNNEVEIENIIEEIKKIMSYMDVMYGIDNPLFMDIYKDKKYIFNTLLPWLGDYCLTINKINKLNKPVNEYLSKFTKNQQLIDMITQHFFENIPTSFALSYFSLYLDYKYPKGGTTVLVEKMESCILKNSGDIKKGTEICGINIEDKKVKAKDGSEYNYKKLIWASDYKKLYNAVDIEVIKDKKAKSNIVKTKEAIRDMKGCESVLTVFLPVNLDKGYFKNICSEHFFYTPSIEGLSSLNMDDILLGDSEEEDILKWFQKYYSLTTYEISIPVIRDDTLAPKGKTGLIISTLLKYEIVKYIYDKGFYEKFKDFSESYIIEVLDRSIFKGLKDKAMKGLVSTPLTIERITGSCDGAITGWAFTNDSIPVVNKFSSIMKATNNEIPDVYQAGQWAYSPAGLPIAIFTGKLAADKAIKKI